MNGYRPGRILFIQYFVMLILLVARSVPQDQWLNVTSDYTALKGDLGIELMEPGSVVQLYEVKTDNNYTLMGTVPVDENWPSNVTIHCGVITKGGRYALQLISNSSTLDVSNTEEDLNEENIVELDVRWPSASLSFEPKRITTYPEPWQQVMVVVRFEEPQCEPAVGSAVPVLWLDVMYCGITAVACNNVSRVASPRDSVEHLIVHSEQIRGYSKFRKVLIKCDAFGIAGFYSAVLRPPERQAVAVAFAAAHEQLEVVANNKFMLNVHGKSIFPCDNYGGGVPIDFHYPSCILPSADKVRLFGRLRDNVSTLLPPTKLHYISEHRIDKGRHNVYFDCELFSEKYIEYCFVYVNQAINKAYTNIKTQCVPTLPITDSDSGQWSKWSEWSPCSTTCYGGTRNRYRTCDSPPPKYGAKFCQGPSLETEKCGEKELYGNECEKVEQQITSSGNHSNTIIKYSEIENEGLPEECRCGCVIHMSKEVRTLRAAAKNCPGRSLWLIKTYDDTIIQLNFPRLYLSCPDQWVKLRDGDSTASNLLAHYEGTSNFLRTIRSTSTNLLLEFFSKPALSSSDECTGGFFAVISRTEANHLNLTDFSHARFKDRVLIIISHIDTFLATISAVILFLVFTCVCFTIQFAERKHKYHKATTVDKQSIGSAQSMLIENDHMTSMTSIQSQALSRNEALSLNTNQDEIERDNDSITKSETANIPDHSVTCSPAKRSCILFESQTSLSSRQTMVQSTSSLNNRDGGRGGQRGRRLHNPLNSSTDSSIHGHDVSDLEMDYYDYNVHNTNSVPGSYIGMDPAYCLWIPPLSDRSPQAADHEAMEMSVLDSKNSKCKRNCEISGKSDNRLSADSESTLVGGDDCISLKTLEASPNRTGQFGKEKHKSEYGNDSSIRFVDEDDGVEIKDTVSDYIDNKIAYNKS